MTSIVLVSNNSIMIAIIYPDNIASFSSFYKNIYSTIETEDYMNYNLRINGMFTNVRFNSTITISLLSNTFNATMTSTTLLINNNQFIVPLNSTTLTYNQMQLILPYFYIHYDLLQNVAYASNISNTIIPHILEYKFYGIDGDYPGLFSPANINPWILNSLYEMLDNQMETLYTINDIYTRILDLLNRHENIKTQIEQLAAYKKIHDAQIGNLNTISSTHDTELNQLWNSEGNNIIVVNNIYNLILNLQQQIHIIDSRLQSIAQQINLLKAI